MYLNVKEQIDAFLGGFHDIISKDLISVFNAKELELLISGLPNFDGKYQIYLVWHCLTFFDDSRRP